METARIAPTPAVRGLSRWVLAVPLALIIAGVTCWYGDMARQAARPAPRMFPPSTAATPNGTETSYGRRYVDAAGFMGLANLRLLGVEHTASAFLRDRDHLIERLQTADVVLLERPQRLGEHGQTAAPVVDGQYFPPIAAWALQHGKVVFFIDSRGYGIARFGGYLASAMAGLLFMAILLLLLDRGRQWRLVMLAAGSALVVGLVSFPSLGMIAAGHLAVSAETEAGIVAALDYSAAIDQFNVVLMDRLSAASRAYPQRQVLAIVGDAHAEVATYYAAHPWMRAWKRAAARWLWSSWEAPIQEVHLTGHPGEISWNPASFASD